MRPGEDRVLWPVLPLLHCCHKWNHAALLLPITCSARPLCPCPWRQLWAQFPWPVMFAAAALHASSTAEHLCSLSRGIRSQRSRCFSFPLASLESWPARDVKNWEATLFSRFHEGGTAKTRGKNYLRMETQRLSTWCPNVILQPKIITRNFPKDFNHWPQGWQCFGLVSRLWN